jgi:Protein of unknown function (DUF3237)
MNSIAPLELTHLFSYSATLQAPEVIGQVPEGIRVNFYVTGGIVHGPRLSGEVLPVGGDWLTLRRDGIAMLDVRATFRTVDGALVYVNYTGIGDLGVDGYEKFLRGQLPQKLGLKTVPVLRTAAAEHEWLHRLLCVGTGEVDFERSEVRYDVFALT